VSKIDEALARIEATEDTSERAFQLAGLVSTLLKIKGIVPVVIGQTALDCYTNGQNGGRVLNLSVFSGTLNPRIMQEVFGEQLHGKGLLTEWEVAGITIRLEEEFISEHRDLCRDFKSDFGIVKLMPAEDLTAAKLWQATRPEVGEAALLQAKALLINALAETFIMDWDILERVCASPPFQVESLLVQMKLEAEEDLAAIRAESPPPAPEVAAPATPPVPTPVATVPRPVSVTPVPTRVTSANVETDNIPVEPGAPAA
jgi:hypothetical protein